MITILENSSTALSSQTSFLGVGSLGFAQMSPSQIDVAVTIGAVALGYALAWIFARAWSIKAMPKAIFIVMFVALFSALLGSIYRNVRPAQPANPNDKWVTLIYKIDAQNESHTPKENGEIARRMYARLQRTFSSDDFLVEDIGNDQLSISFPDSLNPSRNQVKKAIGFNGVLEIRIAASLHETLHEKLIQLSQNSDSNIVVDPETKTKLGDWINCAESFTNTSSLIARPDPENPSRTQVLIYNDKQTVDGIDLDRAYATYDESEQPAVGFVLTPSGSTKFGKLTSKYAKGKNIPDEQKNHLAIILDNELQTSPSLNEAITGGSGIISGIAPNDVAFISSLLSAGQLPIKLEANPTAEKTGPAPERIIDQGNQLNAIVITSILFFVFLITSFILAKRRAREEIPIAQFSPIA